MTTNAIIKQTIEAMNGAVLVPVIVTNHSDMTPEAMATREFVEVTSPKSRLRLAPFSANPLFPNSDTIQDSNALYSMDVETPPRARPTNKYRATGKSVDKHDSEYVMQNAQHMALRPNLSARVPTK